MAKVFVLTSGKGGVGKTTSTAALGAALAECGDTVAIVDFDFGLRNLDLVMGAERRVVFDFIDVMQGTANLSQALIRDKRLDTFGYYRPRRPATRMPLPRMASPKLSRSFAADLIGCFATVLRVSSAARRTPTLPSSSPTRRLPRCAMPTGVIGLLDAKNERGERGEQVEKYLLVSRHDPAPVGEGEMLSIEDVIEILDTPLLGMVPESQEVLRASNLGAPSRYATPQAPRPVPIAMRHAVSRARTCR